MYKDDNLTCGCSDALLRRMIDGSGNSCAECENGCEDRDTRPHPHRDPAGWGLKEYPLASVYAPLQEFDDIYDLDTALSRGTVFSKLDLPFEGDRRVTKGGNCRG